MKDRFDETVAVVVVNYGKILLGTRLKKSYIGLLQLPGGKMDPHETVFQAAIRETKEETGLDITPIKILGDIVSRSLSKRNLYHHRFTVLALAKKNQPINVPDNEIEKCNDWAWYNISGTKGIWHKMNELCQSDIEMYYNADA